MTTEINLGNLIIPIIKPQKGVDYYTEAEKQELISTVTDNVNSVVLPQEEIRQNNETTRQSNEVTRQSQESTRQTNETNRQTAESGRASAESTRQSNETSRLLAEQTRTQTFNNKIQAVDTAIEGIHTSQEAYDQNAQAKTEAFNTNATNKINEYNANATEKIEEYDEHVHDYEQELANKVDKVAGKGLSTNDFTNEKSQQIETNKTNIQTNATNIAQNTTDISNIKTEQITQNNRLTNLETDNETNKTNIENNAQDITDIQEEQTEQNENIVKLQSENETLKSIVNQLPQVEDEGYDATLNDTIKAPFRKFEIEGHSEQETTEGYNLLKYNATNKSYNNNGVVLNYDAETDLITGSGTNTSSSNIATMSGNIDYLNLEPGETYAFSADGTLTNSYIQINYYDNEDAIKKLVSVSEASKIITFTVPSNYNRIQSVFVGILASATININTHIQLEKGNTAHDYEPYTNGASPNPSYEQPIKSAGDNVNLFDGEFINGSESVPDSVYYLFSKNDLKLKNNTYTFNNSLPNSFSYAIMGCINSFPNSDTKQYNSGWKTGGTSLTFTFSQELYFGVLIKKSDSSTIQPGDISNYRFNLQQGTIASPYSPYGMGSITEKIVNKNLWNKSEINWAKNNQGNFELNTSLDNSTVRIRTSSFEIKGGKTYTLSGYPSSISIIDMGYFDKDKNKITGESTRNGNVFTITSKVAYMYILFGGENFTEATNTLMKNADIQIEEGSTATEFIEHQEQTYSIYTQQPFRSIGDVRDCFVKVNGDWFERHKIGQIILDGSESSWTKSGNTTVDRFIINTNLYLSNSNSKCNYFKTGTLNNTNKGQWYNNIGVQLVFNYTNPGTTTLAQWKEWVGTHNLKLIQPLATPIDLPCTQSQIDILENIPSTFSGQTNVFSEDEVKAYLRVKGLKDLNSLQTDIDNVKTAIVALGGVV